MTASLARRGPPLASIESLLRWTNTNTTNTNYQARALRALGLLLADGTPTVGGGKTF